MDIHSYVIFDPRLQKRNASVECHAFRICQKGFSISGFDAVNLKTVVGEWSGALNDCTKYMNGYTRGHRYEGSTLIFDR